MGFNSKTPTRFSGLWQWERKSNYFEKCPECSALQRPTRPSGQGSESRIPPGERHADLILLYLVWFQMKGRRRSLKKKKTLGHRKFKAEDVGPLNDWNCRHSILESSLSLTIYQQANRDPVCWDITTKDLKGTLSHAALNKTNKQDTRSFRPRENAYSKHLP